MPIPDSFPSVSQGFGALSIDGNGNIVSQGIHVSTERTERYTPLSSTADKTSRPREWIFFGPTLTQPTFHWPRRNPAAVVWSDCEGVCKERPPDKDSNNRARRSREERALFEPGREGER
jgi:hypothetical protein